MPESGNLRTASEQHSVKEAVVTFVVEPKLSNLSVVEGLLAEGMPFYNKYQKFEPITIRQIKTDIKLDKTNVSEIMERGFKFISFDSGKASDVIQCIPQGNQSLLTFNTVQYKGWSEYLSNLLFSARVISNMDKSLVLRSVGVMFVDEFYFVDQSVYDPVEIFNVDSKTLPQNILDSDLTDFNLSNHKNKEDIDYMENLSIQVFNDQDCNRKVIRVTGNVMSKISPLLMSDGLDSNDLLRYLDFGHDLNKEMLKGILSKNALKMIGLC